LHARIDEGVVLGYRYPGDSRPLRIGNYAIIRSGTVIYANTTIGDRFQCGHHVLIRAEVIAKAQAAGWRDPNDAYRMVDLSTVKVQEDGSVAGVAEQLAALTTAKPYLLTPTGTLGPTNPGRPGTSAVETDDQRRTRLWGAGDTPIGRGQGGGVFAPE